MRREGQHAIVRSDNHRVVKWIDADRDMPVTYRGTTVDEWYRRDNPHGDSQSSRDGDDWGEGYSTHRAANPAPRGSTSVSSQSDSILSMLKNPADTAGDAAGEFLSIVAHPAIILASNAVSAKVVEKSEKMVMERYPNAPSWASPVVRIGGPFALGSIMAYASDNQHVRSAAIGVGITGVAEGIDYAFSWMGEETPAPASSQKDNNDSSSGDGSDMGAAYASEVREDMGADVVEDPKQLAGHQEEDTSQVQLGASLPGPDSRDPVRNGAL